MLYADDTLLIGTGADEVSELARAVERAGAEYGMSLHWGKVQAMPVCSHKVLLKNDGTPMDQCDAMIYLGGLVSCDGRVDSELSRRIGMACSEFRKLRLVWGHANLSQRQKLDFFQAFVVSKLRYGLGSTWMVKAQRKRLDGFHARCLRKILGISPAYISRTSNAEVFRRANAQPLTEQLWSQRLMLLFRVGRSPAGDPLRRNTFKGATAQPVIGSYVRRPGRPRQDWTSQGLAEAARRCGSYSRMERSLLDTSAGSEKRWRLLMGLCSFGFMA